MSTYELTGKFVATGALAIRGGRYFVAFKPPGEQRNELFEVTFASTGTGFALHSLGFTPGVYYKDGDCALAFNDATGELIMLNFCSTSPTSGNEARPVLWRTGIVVSAAAGSSATDVTARQQIANLITKLHQV